MICQFVHEVIWQGSFEVCVRVCVSMCACVVSCECVCVCMFGAVEIQCWRRHSGVVVGCM